MIIRQSRKEEEARERERTLLALEQERSAPEARAEEEDALASCALAALRTVILSTLQKWVGHLGGK